MTRAAALLTAPALLTNARAVLADFTKRGGSVEFSFLSVWRAEWREDVTKALAKAARAPRKHFGSFDPAKCLTWGASLGLAAEAVAAVLLINAGELQVQA